MTTRDHFALGDLFPKRPPTAAQRKAQATRKAKRQAEADFWASRQPKAGMEGQAAEMVKRLRS